MLYYVPSSFHTWVGILTYEDDHRGMVDVLSINVYMDQNEPPVWHHFVSLN